MKTAEELLELLESAEQLSYVVCSSEELGTNEPELVRLLDLAKVKNIKASFLDMNGLIFLLK